MIDWLKVACGAFSGHYSVARRQGARAGCSVGSGLSQWARGWLSQIAESPTSRPRRTHGFLHARAEQPRELITMVIATH